MVDLRVALAVGAVLLTAGCGHTAPADVSPAGSSPAVTAEAQPQPTPSQAADGRTPDGPRPTPDGPAATRPHGSCDGVTAAQVADLLDTADVTVDDYGHGCRYVTGHGAVEVDRHDTADGPTANAIRQEHRERAPDRRLVDVDVGDGGFATSDGTDLIVTDGTTVLRVSSSLTVDDRIGTSAEIATLHLQAPGR